MKRSKPERLQQNERALTKARKVVKSWSDPNRPTEEVEAEARKHRDNRSPCSCHMCRNPRTSKAFKKGEKRTRQERKADAGKNDHDGL